ncbi:magnesium transporter [Novipirellula artificiosorum]|uniref:Magnesium transporter MgtE n=1 Tax=Novipirellula artificiosorum TaxID=2528016 RepID=A0A5C6D8D1_9BACT|nr:magnesium transporter [Novipirellula artificiosorum]TWU33413.1 Magnesium transporter MgtE [Novipirellula artificiosorum]
MLPDPETHTIVPGPTSVDDLRELIESDAVNDAALVLDRMSEDERSIAVTGLPTEAAADLIEHLVEEQAAEILEQLAPNVAALILEELTSDVRADLIAELATDSASQILDVMSPEEAEETKELSRYDPESAGGLMVTELLAFESSTTVQGVFDDLTTNSDLYRDIDVQYSFVVENDRLVGVLPMRDLFLAKRSTPLREMMIKDPIAVRDDTDMDTLEDVFDNHHFLGIPVVNPAGELVGVVQRTAMEHALAAHDRSDYLKSQGIIGGEEIRSLPVAERARRRLSWLSVNILLNIVAASVIAMFQDTLSSVIALAVFLPIISDMSGCSGNQAVAVSMRELSLGLIRPSELLRVWGKEISVGTINGICLGLLVGMAAFLWKGDPMLGFVVGSALCLNTMVAVSIGGMVPLLMKRFGFDPAIASGPILTTITDMFGFFLVLSMASVLLV